MVKITPQKFKKALFDSGGIKTTIARKLGVTRKAVYDYLERNPKLKILLKHEEEKILDMAEVSLFAQVKNKDFPATKYILSTKGKDRGYTEKQEIEHSGQAQIIIEEHVYDKDKDSIEQEAKAGS
ncbi:hypothetical protein DRO91_10145 [Candidatus Heimdallarchaeota archaeon]|nr:MAG: hypothetical protein DRO91_10145 [Candidatus Heimdallarchaeota archaeon]